MEYCNTSVRKIQPQAYDAFVGMDVDKCSIIASQIDHLGVEKQLRMPYDAAIMIGHLKRHLPGKRVALVYEAGPTGFGLADELLQAEYDCMVVNPACVPTTRGKKVKTNRLDARQLAMQLRGGDLKGILVPNPKYRHLRELVTLRKMFMNESAKCKQRIKALFLRYGFPWPSLNVSSWSNALIQQLQAYECAPVLKYKLDSLLNQLLFARIQAFYAQKEIRRFVAADPELAESVRYAMSVPGIGWIVATYAIARLGDWQELRTSPETSSFFGLAQSENSTGDTIKRGSITKAGDPVLRSLLIQASWTAIRHDSELASGYQRIKNSRAKDKGACIAIVAVARKLATRLHCVLKERRLYQTRALAPI